MLTLDRYIKRYCAIRMDCADLENSFVEHYKDAYRADEVKRDFRARIDEINKKYMIEKEWESYAESFFKVSLGLANSHEQKTFVVAHRLIMSV